MGLDQTLLGFLYGSGPTTTTNPSSGGPRSAPPPLRRPRSSRRRAGSSSKHLARAPPVYGRSLDGLIPHPCGDVFACRPRTDSLTTTARGGGDRGGGGLASLSCCDASAVEAAATVDRARTLASQLLRPRPTGPRRATSRTYDEVLSENERYRDRAEVLRGAPPKTPIEAWLVARNLEKYAPRLERMGVRKVSDLVFLTEDDLNALEIDPHARMHFIVRVVA